MVRYNILSHRILLSTSSTLPNHNNDNHHEVLNFLGRNSDNHPANRLERPGSFTVAFDNGFAFRAFHPKHFLGSWIYGIPSDHRIDKPLVDRLRRVTAGDIERNFPNDLLTPREKTALLKQIVAYLKLVDKRLARLEETVSSPN